MLHFYQGLPHMLLMYTFNDTYAYLRYGSTTTRGTDGGRNPGVRYSAGVPSLLVARRRTITRVDTPTTADHVRPHTTSIEVLYIRLKEIKAQMRSLPNEVNTKWGQYHHTVNHPSLIHLLWFHLRHVKVGQARQEWQHLIWYLEYYSHFILIYQRVWNIKYFACRGTAHVTP